MIAPGGRHADAWFTAFLSPCEGDPRYCQRVTQPIINGSDQVSDLSTAPAKRPGGRPPKPPEQRRSEQWWTRLTPEERDICERAAGGNRAAAAWTRRVLLEAARAELADVNVA
jgi:hypothetical protein